MTDLVFGIREVFEQFGAILELSETGISVPGPRPMFARAAMSEASMSDMPIAEGAQELRAAVYLTVELCQ